MPSVPAGAGAHVLCPLSLHVDPMERLLLVNFERDPDELYVGFEPQVFDDAVHSRGVLVIGWRRDGRVDVYRQPGLRLDPDTYDIAGKGLAHMVEAPLAGARFEVTPSGVDAAFAFDDVLGRPVEVRVLERGRPNRRPFGLLAPMGSTATAPSALPLLFLRDFFFVRRAKSEVSIRVDGRSRRPDTLPVPVGGSRVYFLRYSPDPLIVTLNPAFDGTLTPLDRVGELEARVGELRYDLVERDGRFDVAQLRHGSGPNEVRLTLDPAWPDVRRLDPGARHAGAFTVAADPSVGSVAGAYAVQRDGDVVRMGLVPSGGWRPNEPQLSVRLIYAVAPVFRRWPASYRWEAELDLGDPGSPRLRSRWHRSG
jgi:hypothetical protein